MKNLIVLIGLIALSVATPAKADCSEKLAWAKKVMSGIKHSDLSKEVDENQNLSDEADTAINKKDEKACEAAILNLTKKLVKN
jgi:hypothetical protein